METLLSIQVLNEISQIRRAQFINQFLQKLLALLSDSTPYFLNIFFGNDLSHDFGQWAFSLASAVITDAKVRGKTARGDRGVARRAKPGLHC